MKNHTFKKLSEVADVIRGVAYNAESVFPDKRDETVAILRAGNIQQELIVDNDLIFVNNSFVSNIQLIRKNDIAMCMSSGSAKLVGKTAFSYNDTKCSVGAFCSIIRSKSNILPKYLFYFLNSDLFTRWSYHAEGIGIKNIKLSALKEFLVKYPDIDIQNNIVSILDKINAIILQRQHQLTKLDELVKSRFIEMFGDPNFTNAFCKKQGNMLFNFSSGKFLEVEKRQENGVPVYGGNGISWYTKEPMIDFPTIIIGRVGAYCGNVKIVKEPVWITDNAIYIKKFKTEDYNIDFLYYLMNYLNFSQYAEVSGQPKITQKPLESTEYIVPPLSLQNQFAAFVEQTETTKTAIRQSLERLETLKKSLMQEFFG